MIKSKLWDNKTKVTHVKVARMMDPHKFNFGHFFSSINHPLLPLFLSWGSFLLGVMSKNQKNSIFCLRNVSSSNLKTINWNFSRVPDKILGMLVPKKFWIPWRMTQKQISRKTSLAKYDFRKIWGPCPLATPHWGVFFPQPWWLADVLGVHGNMRGCILKVNFEGLGW